MTRRRQIVISVAAAAMVGISGVGALALGAPPRFSTPSHYDPPGMTVVDMAVGDLNRDGRSDVVVVGGGASPNMTAETSVLLAGRGGRFSAPQSLLLAGGGSQTGGRSVAIADINGDGNRDVVRVWTDDLSSEFPDYPAWVAVLFGDGHGAFPTRKVTSTRCCPDGFTVGEFTGDGKRDLAVVSSYGTGRGWLLVGDGGGGFTAGRPNIGYRGGSPIQPVVADLNRDRRADLVVLHGAEEPHYPTVQFGDGRGAFSRVRFLRKFGAVESFVVGSFNGDRWPDLALTVVSGNFSQRVQVLLGSGSGRFRRAGRYSFGAFPRETYVSWGIVAADLNRDRKQDLAIAGPERRSNFRSSTVRVLLGTGTGFFGRPRTVARCCVTDRPLTVGLFNRDRKPDLASVSARPADIRDTYFEFVSVLLNTTRR